MYFLELLNHKKTGASKYSLNQNQYFIWLESLLFVYICLYQLSKHSSLFLGFPGGSAGKESACNAGDLLEKEMATHSSHGDSRMAELQSVKSQTNRT